MIKTKQSLALRTKSKLGTDKKVKSISRRKPKKGFEFTTSTTLVREYDRQYKFHYHFQTPFDTKRIIINFLLVTGIIYLFIYLFIYIIWRFLHG